MSGEHQSTGWDAVLAAAMDVPKPDDAEFARRDAQRAATWRRMCPDAFDADGVIRPGALVDVINRVTAAGYNPTTGARRDG